MYQVRIPATSANMGVGFDCAGLALDIYNTIAFERRKSGLQIEFAHPEPFVPRDGRNLIVRAARFAADKIGRKLGGLYLRQDDHIPHTRGLGSSAACIVGGIHIANTLLDGRLSREDMLEIATELEGHPDNAAPALYGGVCVSTRYEGKVLTQNIPVREDLAVCPIVPSFTLSTKKSRDVLPAGVTRQDAIQNIACMGLLVSALYTGDYRLLAPAMQDRLHEPYRKALIPGFDDVERVALEQGAYAVCLSGAGPTLLAFYPAGGNSPEKLSAALAGVPGGWKAISSGFDRRGAYVEAL